MPEVSLSSLRLSSIRTQIILGFGLILGVVFLIVLINFVSLITLQAGIDATVDEASRIRELGLEIQNNFLQARQEETQFLEKWRALGFEVAEERHAATNQWRIQAAREGLGELNELVQSSSGDQYAEILAYTEQLAPLLNTYETAFGTTVELIKQRSAAGGLDITFERRTSELDNTVATMSGSDELNRSILQINSSQQAFFNTGERQYLDRAQLLASRSETLINTVPHLSWAYSELTRPGIIDIVNNQFDVFNQLVYLESEISGNAAIFQDVTGDINELTDEIGRQGADSLASARSRLGRTVVGSITISALAGLVALAIGIVTATVLGRRIVGPLTELTGAAQEIGRGNLEQKVAVRGQDEFATLGRVFNQMAEQLSGLIGSLEKLVADRTRALETSFQVSRRLSTILDQRQLVSEVVEQVRTAFDYYHAHIYLFDDERYNLIMVGGTGEAGQAMLATGHKLDRGQGLVGRSADLKRPVVVPDVSQDPNWLPNPLLPNTRSEVAVPIVLGDQVLGVLDVQHDVKGGMSQADAQLLQSIANQVAIALQNARLYEDAQQMAEHEALVNTINQKIQQAASVEGVLQVAARELGKALNARRASVQLRVATQGGDGSPTNGSQRRPPKA